MLHLPHLQEPDVREMIVGLWQNEWDELEARGARGSVYGRNLTEPGWEQFAEAMPTALAAYDEVWLMEQMTASAFWRPFMLRRTRGGVTQVAYNKREAVQQLCVGEFNTAYVHGVARALLNRGETHAEVYRAGPAAEPRSECSGWEGHTVDLETVLAGHRARYFPPPGNRRAWSVPSGVNCHHSIRSTNSAGYGNGGNALTTRSA